MARTKKTCRMAGYQETAQDRSDQYQLEQYYHELNSRAIWKKQRAAWRVKAGRLRVQRASVTLSEEHAVPQPMLTRNEVLKISSQVQKVFSVSAFTTARVVPSRKTNQVSFSYRQGRRDSISLVLTALSNRPRTACSSGWATEATCPAMTVAAQRKF